MRQTCLVLCIYLNIWNKVIQQQLSFKHVLTDLTAVSYWFIFHNEQYEPYIRDPSSCPHRWFSPESHEFARMTMVALQEYWSDTGRRSLKHGWTALSRVTPSSTLTFYSRWQTCCRSTTNQLCSVSSPRKRTGLVQCYCLVIVDPNNPNIDIERQSMWNWQHSNFTQISIL